MANDPIPDEGAERAKGELEVYRPAELSVPEVRELAGDLVNTDFVPKALRGNKGAVLACILTGQELGLGAMQSLAKVHVIEGRPALSAELMRAIVLAAGHILWLEESSDTKVVLCGARREAPDYVTRITWTIDNAKKAQLHGKTNWQRYPRAMLTARATGELCRMVFPDVLAGISYTKEEVDDGFELEEAPTADGIPEGAPAGTPPPPAPRPTRTASDAGRRSRAPEPDGAPAEPPLPDEEDDDVEDAVIVEDATGDAIDVEEAAVAPEPEPKGSGMTPAQYAAMRATEAGLTDDERHGLYVAVTAGRTSSGADLSGEERDRALDLVARIKDGEVALGHELKDGAVEWWAAPVDDPDEWLAYGAQEAPEDQTPPTAPEGENAPQSATEAPEEGESSEEPDLTTEDGWRAWIKGRNLRLPDVLRTAKGIAGQQGMSLGALAGDAELTAKVVAHFDKVAGS